MTLLLLNTTVKSSLIVLLALGAAALLRRQSAAVRHFVLAVALACAAATPAVRSIVPAWHADARMQVIDRPLMVLEETAAPPAAAVAPSLRRGVTMQSVLQASEIVWAGGAAVAVFMLLVGLARLSWIASNAIPVVSGPWTAAAAALARTHGWRRVPVILQSTHRSALGTWGVWRPKIVLPAGANRWPDDRIRIVLAHEFAHIRRRDWIVQTAAELIVAVYWFNPLVRLAAHRLRLESEQACDDAVLRCGVEAADYASELVGLVRACRPGRLLPVPTATIVRPGILERRVRAMLNATVNRDPLTRSTSLATALALAVLTVSLAGLGVSAQGQFATVSGSVTDQNGRSIGGVTLVLSNRAAATRTEIKSDAGGHYEFVGISAGSYELTFELPGMATIKREGLSLSAGQAVTVDAVMRLGTVQETITVTPGAAAEPPRVIDYTGARANQKPDPCAASANGGCVRPPAKIKHVSPVYPAGAPAGSVELTATIGVDGHVTDLDVVGDGHGGPADLQLADAAAAAVRQWEFLETHLDGQPIETHMIVHVQFTTNR
jgi:beta-lactamase regulating signal transducer with metallopeptidase domain